MTLHEFFFYLLLLIFAPRSLKTMEWRMLRYLNRDRRWNHLAPLRMQEDLRTVARKHSLDMADKDYFDHVNPARQAPSDRLRLAGVTEVVSGENLAKIGGYPNPTQKAEKGLMESPGHRANILNRDYNSVGIGIIQDRRGVYYFTQNFARRILILQKSAVRNSQSVLTVRLKKGLRIRGQIFSSGQKILWQVKIAKSEKVEKEGLVQAEQGKFDFIIHFGAAGRYEILLFVNGKNPHKPNEYELANSFEVMVKRGFWG